MGFAKKFIAFRDKRSCKFKINIKFKIKLSVIIPKFLLLYHKPLKKILMISLKNFSETFKEWKEVPIPQRVRLMLKY